MQNINHVYFNAAFNNNPYKQGLALVIFNMMLKPFLSQLNRIIFKCLYTYFATYIMGSGGPAQAPLKQV
jgi:hypothetical protein